MGVKFVALVTALAAVEVLVFGMLVGRARGIYGVQAPAMSGHPAWERINRVHQNSIEQLVVFVPLLWAYAASVSWMGAGVLGAVFIVARIIYAVGYARDPAKRGPGSFMTFVVQWILALGAVIGFVVQIARS